MCGIDSCPALPERPLQNVCVPVPGLTCVCDAVGTCLQAVDGNKASVKY